MLGIIDALRRPVAPQRPYDSPAPGRVPAGGVRRALGQAISRATALSAKPKSLPARAMDLGAGALLAHRYARARREGRGEAGAAAGVALWVMGDEFLLPLVSMSGEPWRGSVVRQLYRMGGRALVAVAVAAACGAFTRR